MTAFPLRQPADRAGDAAAEDQTNRGWLLLIHAVGDDPGRGRNGWEEKWTERYSMGVLLLDLEDPRRVAGLSPVPLLTSACAPP